jgi:hypothetical protein
MKLGYANYLRCETANVMLLPTLRLARHPDNKIYTMACRFCTRDARLRMQCLPPFRTPLPLGCLADKVAQKGHGGQLAVRCVRAFCPSGVVAQALGKTFPIPFRNVILFEL